MEPFVLQRPIPNVHELHFPAGNNVYWIKYHDNRFRVPETWYRMYTEPTIVNFLDDAARQYGQNGQLPHRCRIKHDRTEMYGDSYLVFAEEIITLYQAKILQSYKRLVIHGNGYYRRRPIPIIIENEEDGAGPGGPSINASPSGNNGSNNVAGPNFLNKYRCLPGPSNAYEPSNVVGPSVINGHREAPGPSHAVGSSVYNRHRDAPGPSNAAGPSNIAGPSSIIRHRDVPGSTNVAGPTVINRHRDVPGPSGAGRSNYR